MTWLVTGGAGFVGVNLLRRLGRDGIRARVLDNFTTGRREDLAGLTTDVVEGDIRDAAVVERVLDGVEAVVHLAAHTRVIESMADPVGSFDVNARGVLTMLEAVRRRKDVRHSCSRRPAAPSSRRDAARPPGRTGPAARAP